jgi:ribosomal protein S18
MRARNKRVKISRRNGGGQQTSVTKRRAARFTLTGIERYKFRDLETLAEFLSSKKRILDAGTGVGRDTRLYADNSPAEVFGVDFSLAIDSAYNPHEF